MDIGMGSLCLYGLNSTDSFHVTIGIKIVMGQLVHYGFPCDRIIVAICNIRSVLIVSIAEEIVETYDQECTAETVTEHNALFIWHFGCRIDNIIPVPFRNQATLSYSDRQRVSELFITYTHKVNALHQLFPPDQPVKEVPNVLPVVVTDPDSPVNFLSGF